MSNIAWFKRMVNVFGNTVANASVTAAKMAADSILAASIKAGEIVNSHINATAGIAVTKLALANGKVIIGGAGGAGAAQSLAGDVTVDNAGATLLNAAHQEQLVLVAVEDLAAGVDIADRPAYVHPRANTLQSVGVLTWGAPAGVDDGNTAVITLKDDAGNTIVTKTYNAGAQPPTSDYADLGALDGTHKVLAAGEHATLSVTQGATANMPAFQLVIRTIPTNA